MNFNFAKYGRKSGFTLIELLVVVATIGVLMSMLLPAARRARMQAKVTVVNAELREIGLALECYFIDHMTYPPTREDCGLGSLNAHLYQLPPELAEGGYLPVTEKSEAMSTVIEDRFNRGHTYKYRSCGEVIRDRDLISPWIKARLWVPDGFSGKSSLDEEEGQWYDHWRKSPVHWVVFSVGPGFNEEEFLDNVANRFPVPKEIWYDSGEQRGLVVRMKMENGDNIGTFSGDK